MGSKPLKIGLLPLKIGLLPQILLYQGHMRDPDQIICQNLTAAESIHMHTLAMECAVRRHTLMDWFPA
jgi:hypothetical protein